MPPAVGHPESLAGSLLPDTGTVFAKSRPATSGRFIVSGRYDLAFFIGSPIVALVIGMALSHLTLGGREIDAFGYTASLTSLLALTEAHIFLVFFRSHGNRKIFSRHPLRFTLVPVLLFAAILASPWTMALAAVVVVWWDVYHSSLQTFGIGRIYDAKVGNDPDTGRRLDFVLSLYIYVGPVLAGAVLVDHTASLEAFKWVSPEVLARTVPAAINAQAGMLFWLVIGTGLPFVGYYCWAYRRLYQRGHRISGPKVMLYATTALCSLWTWGFNSFGEAFFVMNFFHAVQYFALVWWTERRNLSQRLRLSRVKGGALFTGMVFFGTALAYGFWAEFAPNTELSFAMIKVVAILHFWYDGFIWSVKKADV